MTSCLKTTNFTVVVNCLYYRNKVRKVYCLLWTTDDGGSTRSTVTLGKRQLKYKYWREFAENFHELLRMPLFGCLILCCCSAVVGESVLTEAKIQAGNDISYKMFFFSFCFISVCFFSFVFWEMPVSRAQLLCWFQYSQTCSYTEFCCQSEWRGRQPLCFSLHRNQKHRLFQWDHGDQSVLWGWPDTTNSNKISNDGKTHSLLSEDGFVMPWLWVFVSGHQRAYVGSLISDSGWKGPLHPLYTYWCGHYQSTSVSSSNFSPEWTQIIPESVIGQRR